MKHYIISERTLLSLYRAEEELNAKFLINL